MYVYVHLSFHNKFDAEVSVVVKQIYGREAISAVILIYIVNKLSTFYAQNVDNLGAGLVL